MPIDNVNTNETGFWLGFPFDSEIFINDWNETPDPFLFALLESGVLVDDAAITQELSGGGNLFTIPFYDSLTGTPANYDGTIDIPIVETQGRTQTGMAWGRTHGWEGRNFINDLSGRDPLTNMAQRVAKFWNVYRQNTILNILEALFTSTSPDPYTTEFVANHTLVSPSAIGITDINTLAQQSLGDNRNAFSLMIAHSRVVARLENLNLVDFARYSTVNAVPSSWRVGYIGGHTLIEFDGVPVSGNEYTTYLLGQGVIRHARGRLTQPQVEPNRDPVRYGGVDMLLTRIREVFHPNGWTFRLPPTVNTPSPSDAHIADPDHWTAIYTPKAIPIARLITDESVV